MTYGLLFIHCKASSAQPDLCLLSFGEGFDGSHSHSVTGGNKCSGVFCARFGVTFAHGGASPDIEMAKSPQKIQEGLLDCTTEIFDKTSHFSACWLLSGCCSCCFPTELKWFTRDVNSRLLTILKRCPARSVFSTLTADVLTGFKTWAEVEKMSKISLWKLYFGPWKDVTRTSVANVERTSKKDDWLSTGRLFNIGKDAELTSFGCVFA